MDELTWISGPVFALVGVFLGWILSNQTQKKMLKVAQTRNELEKAYGTLYSILSKPEEMVKVKTGSEAKVVVSRMEKTELDRILMSYPYVFPQRIVVIWRTEIRDVEPCRFLTVGRETQFFYGIPVRFKEEVSREYQQRLEEYYKMTGRGKSLKGIPKWARV